jgi:hypothetical protein
VGAFCEPGEWVFGLALVFFASEVEIAERGEVGTVESGIG